MKFKCTKTVEFMGKKVYNEGMVYEAKENIEEGVISGYMINGEYGVEYISIDDKEMSNFEKVVDTYEIKAISKKDIKNNEAWVVSYNGDKFTYISELSIGKRIEIQYEAEDVFYSDEWLVYEVLNDDVSKLKKKNVEKAIIKYKTQDVVK